MPPNNANKPDPATQAAFEAKLKEEHVLTFTTGELLAIFNILTQVGMKYGEFKIISPIIEKITPIVAVDSNIPPKEDNAIVGGKKGIVS